MFIHHHYRPEEDAHHPLALLVLEGLCRVEEEESIEGQQTKRAGGEIKNVHNFNQTAHSIQNWTDLAKAGRAM